MNCGTVSGLKFHPLCWIGVHRWRYWRMAVEFIKAFQDSQNVCRACERCGVNQITDDGRKWEWRI
jgi:hypothetical protein